MATQTLFLLRQGFAVLTFIAFVLTQNVYSQQVNFSYSGIVQDGLTSGFLFLPAAPDTDDSPTFDAFNGQAISLVFSLDAGLVDSNDLADVGIFSPVTDYEVRIGDTVYTASPSGGRINVSNLSTDTFEFSGDLEGPTLVGAVYYSLARVQLRFRDSSGVVFNNDGLPSTQLVASDFSSASLIVDFSSDDGGFASYTGYGMVGTNLLEVPEPLRGDVNCDGRIDFLDIAPFISTLSSGGFSAKADIDQDGSVTFLDISPFISLLAG